MVTLKVIKTGEGETDIRIIGRQSVCGFKRRARACIIFFGHPGQAEFEPEIGIFAVLCQTGTRQFGGALIIAIQPRLSCLLLKCQFVGGRNADRVQGQKDRSDTQ